jgi:putative ABC transport system substrate-binding protein
MLRARTYRSCTVGPTLNLIACRNWRPMVRRRVGVIATVGAASIFAAKAATSTIPIIFITGDDPVGIGPVSSLARPAGNLTGVSFSTTELAAKRLELLRELIPRAARVAVLVNPANAKTTEATLQDLEPAARTMGLQIQVLNARACPQLSKITLATR